MNRRGFVKSLAGLAAAMSTGTRLSAKSGRPSGPNVLVIMSDEHRADTCGCYGSAVRTRDGGSPTPHIDALARQGVRFGSFYCASPLCAPSRAAYMTGCYPHTTTALHHKMQGREAGVTRFPGVRADLKGMGECFRQAGYRTATIGKVHVHGEMVDGWDLGFDVRKLRYYTEFPGSDYKQLKGGDLKRRYREMKPYEGQFYRDIDPPRFANAPAGLKVKDNACNQHFQETLIQHDEEMFDLMVTRVSEGFIRECHEAEAPFFIHVGLEKPHRPWSNRRKYLDRFEPSAMPLPETVASWVRLGELPLVEHWQHSRLAGDDARRSIASYYGCVSEVDECVGRLVALVDELGIRDNTIIVYSSDHGENLFEHGLIEKHNMLEAPVAVPMIVSYARELGEGSTCQAPGSLVDLLPTLADLCEVKPDAHWEGRSLLPQVAGREDPDRVIFSEFYQAGNNCWPHKYTPKRMALDRNFKYVYTHAALDQLYARPPADSRDETLNLALDPAYRDTVRRLKLAALASWELDEYPQLAIAAQVHGAAVELTWETWPEAADYDVFRNTRPDTTGAALVAARVTASHYRDTAAPAGSTVYYWIVANPKLTQPFADSRGLRRYGDLPVKTETHPMKLPVSVRLEVPVQDGRKAEARYQPVLGVECFGRQWFHIGYAPVFADGVLRGRGPCLMLALSDPCREAVLEAEMRTASPGSEADHTLAIVLNYDTMDDYHRVLLDMNGCLVLQRRTGQRFRELARVEAKGLAFASNRLAVTVKGRKITALLSNGAPLEFESPDPLPAGRFGVEADLGLASYEVRRLEFHPA